MPGRLVPLVTGEYYHLYNRGSNKQPIFKDIKDYNRALQLFEFYSYSNTPLRYSKFLILSREEREKILISLKQENKRLVESACFVLMPNHFHFLLKQLEDNGISKFMGNFQNSYTRYFNTKLDNIGPLLQGQFKGVRVEDDVQLLHLTRYIHLNPYTSYVVKEILDLEHYLWSSYPEYLGGEIKQLCNKEIILSQFKNIEEYKIFVEDRASYQRDLDKIKHLILER